MFVTNDVMVTHKVCGKDRKVAEELRYWIACRAEKIRMPMFRTRSFVEASKQLPWPFFSRRAEGGDLVVEGRGVE